MFVILPLGTDNLIRRRPWVNIALIVANVLVFVLLDIAGPDISPKLTVLRNDMMLWAESPRWFQFFTTMFLHGGWIHLIFNMIFLWTFGNSLEHKLGHLAYLMFYLACGLFAGVGYVLTATMPAVGASGAIFGVAAGYLVLFPLSRVSTLYWIVFFIGFIDLSGLTLIGCFIVYAAYNVAVGSADGVAHMAHLAGAVFGLTAAALLLATRAVGRDQFDLLALAKRWNQRRSYKSYMSDSQRQARAQYGRVARDVTAREISSRTAAPPDDHITELRSRVLAMMRDGNTPAAADAWRELRQADSGQVLPASQQLELANQFMSSGEHAVAADAYEAFLGRYPTRPDVPQVELLLGIIYSRYVRNADRARACLGRAIEKLEDPAGRDLARKELDSLDEPAA